MFIGGKILLVQTLLTKVVEVNFVIEFGLKDFSDIVIDWFLQQVLIETFVFIFVYWKKGIDLYSKNARQQTELTVKKGRCCSEKLWNVGF